MKINSDSTAHVSGICVIIASLLVSGCAHQAGVQTMRSVDLGYFQVNCDIKQEQIKFLQSQRVSRDQQFFARVANLVKPWELVTDPDKFAQRRRIGQGHTNWLIDQQLMQIAKDCG